MLTLFKDGPEVFFESINHTLVITSVNALMTYFIPVVVYSCLMFYQIATLNSYFDVQRAFF